MESPTDPYVSYQWVFVQAHGISGAVKAANAAVVECLWALDWHVERADALAGVDVRRAVEQASAEQNRHLSNLAASAIDDPISVLAADHDPTSAWSDGGRQALFLSAAVDIVAGAWTPLSGGVDAVNHTSLFPFVLARVQSSPSQQWAVPVSIEVSQ